MTTDIQPSGVGTVERQAGTGLADVLDTILDKGMVIDAYVDASVVGINILTINARVVVASVDTYLRFAERVNRLDLAESKGEGVRDLVQDVQQIGAGDSVKGATKPVLEAVGQKLGDVLPGSAERQGD
jgi:hypothetical protein